jgi:hypothetical protein
MEACTRKQQLLSLSLLLLELPLPSQLLLPACPPEAVVSAHPLQLQQLAFEEVLRLLVQVAACGVLWKGKRQHSSSPAVVQHQGLVVLVAPKVRCC